MRELNEFKEELKNLNASEIIKWGIDKFGSDRIVLASSMGLEDQVLIDMLLKITKDVQMFTIDTGRLFQETYLTIENTEKKYNIKIKIYFPDYKDVESMVNEKGINLFYESIENRKLCCETRKIKPLKRALEGFTCWICGLRKEQAVTRKNVDVIEWDEKNGLYKLNPIYNWTTKQLWEYVKENKVPYNILHNEGYTSIGCKPCTRAIKEGDDIRYGRWWWENPEHKECGLHSRR